MTVFELMVGDWVLSPAGTPLQVVDIIGSKNLLNLSQGNPAYSDPSDCKPIQLTQAILGNSGFKLTGSHNVHKWELYENGTLVVVKFYGGGRIREEVYVEDILAKADNIGFAHQLQHSMKEYGIEKEIKL